MEHIIYFFIIFVIVDTVYILFINRKKLKKKDYQKLGEINYLIRRFGLDSKRINYKALSYITASVNAFIIAAVCVIISLIKIKFIWQMLIGFALLFAMIYALYEILGRILIKKGWR